MKKILSVVMAIVMVLTISSFAMITFATQGEELISNGGFSSVKNSDNSQVNFWSSQSGATIKRYNLGSWIRPDYVLQVTDRTEDWSSPVQNVTAGVMQSGWGEYTVSAKVKLINASSGVITYVVNTNIDGESGWQTISAQVNDLEFITFVGNISISPKNADSVLSSVYVYFQMTKGIEFYVDDVSLYKTDANTQDPIAPAIPENNGPITNRPTETSVGVIRWDAWLNPSVAWQDASNPEDTRTIGQQMVDSLSPQKYHYRLPFFANILGSNSITFPDYTQEIFDQEMRYAKEAGIDYFTYCWYGEDDAMSTARKLHTTSKYKNDVKMSAIWTIYGITADTTDYLIDFLKQDYWFKVDGRPLIYVNNAEITSIYAINKFREACIEAGAGNPYLIGLENMGCSTDDVKNLGLDAISTYATYQGGGAEYSELVKTTEADWTKWKNAGVEVVPFVSTGWNRNPRVANPPSWEKGHTGTENDYTQDGTPEEIAQHLQDAINFNKNNQTQTSANTVLMYAWNEHDEGGWICPTIKVDGNGLALTNSDGSNKRDDSRLQAIQKVLKGADAKWNINDVSITYCFKGATLNIGSTLSINYYAKTNGNYKVKFTMNGREYQSNAVFDEKEQLYKFTFSGVNPQCMNDIIDAVLLDEYGNIIDEYNGYSVRAYCNSLASKTATELEQTVIQYNAMLKLLADTLNYGAEAQKYREYKTDTLANSELWVIQNQSSFKKPQGVANLKGNQNTEGQIKSAGLSISNVNKLYFRLILNNPDVVVNLNGNIIDRQSLEYNNANGTYVLYTEELTATQFDKVFTLTLSLNDQTISSLEYNVKAYVEAKYESASVGKIVKALNSYGDSAVYYVKAINNQLDLDFDLGFDELLTDNVIPNLASTFEVTSPEAVGWYVPTNWNTTLSLVDDGNGGQALAFTTGESWDSAAFNIQPYVKAGTYTVSFRYKVIGEVGFAATLRYNQGINHPFNEYVTPVGDGVWGEFVGTITITENDTYQTSLDFCMHSISGSGWICIDDFQIIPN